MAAGEILASTALLVAAFGALRRSELRTWFYVLIACSLVLSATCMLVAGSAGWAAALYAAAAVAAAVGIHTHRHGNPRREGC